MNVSSALGEQPSTDPPVAMNDECQGLIAEALESGVEVYLQDVKADFWAKQPDDPAAVLADILGVFHEGEGRVPVTDLVGRLATAHGDLYADLSVGDFQEALSRFGVTPEHVWVSSTPDGKGRLRRGVRRSDLVAAMERPAPTPYRPHLVERPWPVIDAAAQACTRVMPILTASLYLAMAAAIVLLLLRGW